MAITLINDKNEVAILYPDTVINMEKNNPLFMTDDKFGEDVTYSFKLPNTYENQLFFSNGHLIEVENNVYKLNVRCNFSDYINYKGSLVYRLDQNDFNATLLVNFGDLKDKLGQIKLPDLYLDTSPISITPTLMYDTCANPGNYPFAFFTVKNDDWKSNKPTLPVYINDWNALFQSFVITTQTLTDYSYSGQCPYFKLKYIITKIGEALNFQVGGSFISDAAADKIYLYAKMYCMDTSLEYSSYFPNVTIAEFLKILKMRFRIAFSFDLYKGELRVDWPNSLFNSSEIVDLSSYVARVESIEVQDKSGYTVSLTPDKNDALFNDPEDASIQSPTSRLTVGNGENTIEIKASTLKLEVTYAGLEETATVATSQRLDYTHENNTSVRFIKFEGWKNFQGKKYPTAKPMELTTDDAFWYVFLNNSKVIKLKLFLPPHVLFGLKSTQIISFYSEQGFFVKAMVKKIEFDMSNKELNYIETSIDCQTINYAIDTSINIKPTKSEVTQGKIEFKAYFPDGLNGINYKLSFPAGSSLSTSTTLPQTKEYDGFIGSSTDKHRGGGDSCWTTYVEVIPALQALLKVYHAVPKYVVANGVKIYFTKENDYYVASPFIASNVTPIIDNKPVWIVF